MVYGAIEGVIADLIFHLSRCVTSTFEEDKAWDTLRVLVAHMDPRDRIAAAKSLASHIKTPASPFFYDRVAELLNHVDNEVRPERNRYVHDSWSSSGRGGVTRIALAPKVLKQAKPHDRVWAMYAERPYRSTRAVEKFVAHLELVYDDLVELDNHLAWLVGALETPSGSLQPLPKAWRSFSHHGWRDPSTPAPRQKSSKRKPSRP